MNLNNGQGWVSIAHLVVIGPLWIALTGITLYALIPRIARHGSQPVK